MKEVQACAKQFRPLLVKYCSKTLSAQADCLEAVEDFCVGNEAMERVASKVLHLLYDIDVVSEDAILKWYEGETDAVEVRSKGFGAGFRKGVKPFIEWLQESEEEESD